MPLSEWILDLCTELSTDIVDRNIILNFLKFVSGFGL